MGCSKAFWGNANGVEHPCKVTSHVGTTINVSREIMTRPRKLKSKNVPKTTKIEGYYTCFKTFSRLELPTLWDASEGHERSLERMWMPLGSFRGNFGFNEKWTNGVFYRLFKAMQMLLSTLAELQVMSALLRIFREKIWSSPEKSKNIPKTTKIEVYNTLLDLSGAWAPNTTDTS